MAPPRLSKNPCYAVAQQRFFFKGSNYADEGISGVSTNKREQFKKMIKDCEDGKIDMVITKPISCFARNTQDCLQYSRKLKNLGIGIFFEKKDFYTGEVPKSAVKWAFFGIFWVLGRRNLKK